MADVSKAREKVMRYSNNLNVFSGNAGQFVQDVQDVQTLIDAIREDSTRRTLEETLAALDDRTVEFARDYLKIRLETLGDHYDV